MKTIKNDTRYIIKRVLIGVLIAILLFNARKCGVYAEQREININVNNMTQLNNVSNYKYLSTFENEDIKLNFYTSVFTWDNAVVYIHKNTYDKTRYYFQVNVFENVNFSNIKSASLGLVKEANPSSSKISFPPNVYLYDKNDNVLCNTATTTGCDGTGLKPKASMYNQNSWYYFDYSTLTLGQAYSTYNFTNLYRGGYIDYFSSNAPYSISFGTIEEYQPAPQFPPSGYSELDLTGYQGAFFVPKNYNNMNCSEVGDLCNISFDFYYQNSVSGAYFPLDNQNLVTDLTDYLSSDEPTLESSYFPLMQILQENDFSTAYRYYAYLIYNRTPATYDWRDAIQNPYGSSKVWYNSDLYDYYLVEDFSTYTNNICFLDITNAQMCVDIKNIPTFLDSLNDAQEWQEAVGESKNINFKYNNFVFDFLKIPFTFLRSIVNNTCTFFEIPIPILGGTITLNCLSDTFKNVLGVGYYFIVGLINFVLLYRVTIYNIHTFKESLDPDKTSMEVVDL